MKDNSHHPLELRLSMNIGYSIEVHGLMGVFANAFLSGAFDGVDAGNQWYDHPCLLRSMHFRRESMLEREADWPAEWLALLRMEGATQLRLHFQTYKGFQQHYAIVSSSGPVAPVWSAWGPSLFGLRCLSSWSPSLVPSRSRARQQKGLNEFSYPLGTPAALVFEEVLRTERLLDDARTCDVDVTALHVRMDSLYAEGRQVGYVLDDFPAHRSDRLSWALDRLGANAPIDAYHPHPVFPADSRADIVREIYLDMALLQGQLAQLPEFTPRHPYDDFNCGPIYPRSDADGRIYRNLKQGLEKTAQEWLALCYRPWEGATSLAPDQRLNQRIPMDVTYSRNEYQKVLTRPPIRP